MRGPLFILLLVVAIGTELSRAWKPDVEYQYDVRGRTLSGLQDVADQYSGILTRCLLIVQPKSDGTLETKIIQARYAQIHTELPDGWDSEIPESMLEFKPLPMSERVFEIRMKHGVVRDVIVDKNVATWEVNVIKSIVGQLQVDTQGENLMASSYNQEPEESGISAVFKTMEDSVGGNCEVLYDVNPLSELIVQNQPELLPLPDIRDDGYTIDIVKTKNFSNCEQRSGYHFGIPGSNDWEPGASDNGNFLSRSSISRVIVTGDLANFTIQSSVTTNKVVVSPNFYESRKAMVGSRVNLTLVKIGPPSTVPWSIPLSPESVGNLVYSYNDPFATSDEGRLVGPPPDNRDSDEQKNDLYNRYLPKKSNNDDGDGYDSSRSADSMESNEALWYLQPIPTLDEAPAVPLLPYFIGNRGKTIGQAEGFDVVATIKSLAGQIGSELQNSSSITDELTLEKFSILAKIIRTMNASQIAEAEVELYQSANEINPLDDSQSVRRGTWIAFRDAVAQAGTGPALITIKTWIKQNKIQGYEAASVVEVLSKSARTPTQEYLNAFFELATMPETTGQPFLNSSALLTFAELVRYSGYHNRYPVHTFGRFTPKDNPAIVSTYLPYLSGELNKSIENNEYARSHTFITALGNVAHPNVLAIFEPYLEGDILASTFQRLLMVFSIKKLAAREPTLARPIFYRIYQNTGEAHQLRCASVFLLMTTNPPATMIQRMAEFTNIDLSKHVNAAVKSAIVSAGKLKTPEFQELAKNSRNAEVLLTKESFGLEYTTNYLSDYIDKKDNLAYRLYATSIGSDDGYISDVYYASLQAIFGGFEVPEMDVGAMVSSVKDLYSTLQTLFKDQPKVSQTDKVEFAPENIAKLLNIEAESKPNLEGAFTFRTGYDNKFMSFDKNTLQRLSELTGKAAMALKDGQNFDVVNIESADVTVSFPMESGFPFVYTLKIPWVKKLSGFVKGDDNLESIKGILELRAMWSISFQARLGFITPFEHQHYMAGIDKNYQVNVPIRAEMNYDRADNNVTLKLQPIEPTERQKLFHQSIVPFTSCHDILNVLPIMKDPKTHKLINGMPVKQIVPMGSPTHGLSLTVETESAISPKSNGKKKKKRLPKFVFIFTEEPDYHKTEVFLEPNLLSEQSIVLTGSFETLHDDTTPYDAASSSAIIDAKSPVVTNKNQNDPARRKELLLEAASGIAAADAFAVDFSVELPGTEPIVWLGTVAYADSKVDEKSRGLGYWRLTSVSSNLEFETCAGLESRSSKLSSLENDISDASSNITRDFDIELRVGVTCETGEIIKIRANQTQTKEYRDAIKAFRSAIDCFKAPNKGVKSALACRDFNVKASTLDTTRLTMTYDETVRSAQLEIDSYVNAIRDFVDNVHSGQKTRPDDSTNKNSVELVMRWSPINETANFYYESDNVQLVGQDVSVGAIGPIVSNINPDLTTVDHLYVGLGDASLRQHTCILDSNSLTTFDSSSYPVNLGKCWHVAMTTFPKTTKDSGAVDPIDEDMAISILVRDSGVNGKDVKITLGNNELQFSNTGTEILVTLDAQKLNFKDKPNYRQMSGKNIDFEVFKLSDGSIGLSSDKYGIDTAFNGQRFQIKASGKYRSDVRGLCGNFDGEPTNDFTSPKDCVLSTPKVFTASYVLPTTECQGQTRILAAKSDTAVCLKQSSTPGNVVSDREAGRVPVANGTWGFHNKLKLKIDKKNKASGKLCTAHRTKIIEEPDQTCFSLKPMPICNVGCEPIKVKPKIISVYCIAVGPAAQRMVSLIERGANPDFSQKPTTKKSTFDLPIGCRAA